MEAVIYEISTSAERVDTGGRTGDTCAERRGRACRTCSRAQEQSGVLAQALADGALIRLHIVADDDSDEAQRVKLCVRDVLLDRFSAELSALDAPEAALEWLNAHLSEIEQAADAELRAQGAAYTARAVLGEQDFPDREYGGQAVRRGRYMALRLELGRRRDATGGASYTRRCARCRRI